MNIYEALIGGTPAEEPDIQALAQQLRRRNAAATLGQLSGDKILGNYGAGASENIQADLGRLGTDTRARKTREAEMQRHEDNVKLKKAKQAMMENYYKGTLAEKREKRLAKASEVKPGRSMPKALRDGLMNAGDEVVVTKSLLERADAVKPWQEAAPYLNTAGVWVANELGIGTDAFKEKSNWWQEFNLRWNLVKRQEKFGATLTGNEQKSWRSATISQELSEEQLKTRMKVLVRFSMYHRKRLVEGTKAGMRYTDKQIDLLANMEDLDYNDIDIGTGDYVDDTDAADASDSAAEAAATAKDNAEALDEERVFNAATGEWE